MIQVLVVFGGCSSEYGVSLQSAAGVIDHLNRSKYKPITVGITREGQWRFFTGTTDEIRDDSWSKNQSNCDVVISPNRNRKELLVFGSEMITRIPIDVVFPVLHGRNGEDGTIQGMCELAGLPIVGCNTLASALCMDKDRAHKLVSLAGVRTPLSICFGHCYDAEHVKIQVDEIGYPVFVKPVKAGSSYGITKVKGVGELFEAIETAFTYDNEVIIEEAIDGFEVGCAVMGYEEPITGVIDEIELAEGFFDFTEKYNLITSKIHVPARVSAEKMEEIKQTAIIIYHTLGCGGLARVDMFVTKSGEIVFNEVNTIPGFTAHSRFPNMMKSAGISFEDILDNVIRGAINRIEN